MNVKPIRHMDAETARESIISILGEEDGWRALANFWEMLSTDTIRTRYTDGSVRLDYYNPKTGNTKILNVNADRTWDVLETDGNQETREEYVPYHTAHIMKFVNHQLVRAEWRRWENGKLETIEWKPITPETAEELLSSVEMDVNPKHIWECECSPDRILHFECPIFGYAYQVDLNNRKYRKRGLRRPYAWTEWERIKSPMQLNV